MKALDTLLIFVVEDNEFYGNLLTYQLAQNPDYEVRHLTSVKECLSHLHERPALITLDYRLPDAVGEQALRQIHERLPNVPVVIISGQQDVGTAVAMLQHGAFDYLVKNEQTVEHLRLAVQRVAERVWAQQKAAPPLAADEQYNFTQAIIGEHTAMVQLRALITKAAATSISVSVSGETGTGKELVAQAIHRLSGRAGRPFVAMNMAAIPRELLESELFGHEKGAFSGAVARRVGRFEEAHGGTLFLDEISDLDIGLQAKLLRVLQERTLVPVGGSRAVPFDVRLIVASHRDLHSEMQAGRFREDLYFRLLGLPIVVPPLRQRGHDVLLLANDFLRLFCALNGLPRRYLSTPAQKMLLAYPFPGNVRELKAVVELAAVLAENIYIYPQHLPINLEPDTPGTATLRAQTANIVQRCLDELKGDVPAAAARLGVSRSTIYRLIQNHEITLAR